MKRAALIGIALMAVAVVSGCTNILTTDKITINDIPYDTFTTTLDPTSCEMGLKVGEKGKYDCLISEVNMQEKIFGCSCIKKGLI